MSAVSNSDAKGVLSGGGNSGAGSGVTLVVDPRTANGAGGSAGSTTSGVSINPDGTIVATLQLPQIACCLCGTKIQSNPTNMCLNCLQHQVDLASAIPKTYALPQCPNCERFESNGHFTAVQLESRELLAVCLKKMSRLTKDCKLTDAAFIWTEPHSKRVKLRLTIQREVFTAALMQQTFMVEFVITSQQCTECQKSFTEHTWAALVQIRQKGVKHRKTLFYLEQLILKSGAAAKAMAVKEEGGGLDLYFQTKSQGSHLVEFVTSVVPSKVTQSLRVVSIDQSNNTTASKHTFAIEVAPICKGDLVCLPPKLAQQLGGISPLLLCYRVTASIYLLDPLSLRTVDINAHLYFRNPFVAVLTAKQLIEYTVLDIDFESAPDVSVSASASTLTTPKAGSAKGSKTTTAVRGGSTITPLVNTDIKSAASKQPQMQTVITFRDSPAPAATATATATATAQPLIPAAAANTNSAAVTSTNGSTSNVSTAPASPVSVATTSGSTTLPAPPIIILPASGGGATADRESSRQRQQKKLSLAGATVARSVDFGVNNDTGFAITHLGFLLKSGDTAFGYDVSRAVLTDESLKVLKGRKLPDIILVKKSYPKSKKKSRGRAFKLKHLSKSSSMAAGSGTAANKKKKQSLSEMEKDASEYDEFLGDLEEDPEMRKNVLMFATDSAGAAPHAAPEPNRAARKKARMAAAAAARAAALAAGEQQKEAEPESEPESDTESMAGDAVTADELIVESTDGIEPPSPAPAPSDTATTA